MSRITKNLKSNLIVAIGSLLFTTKISNKKSPVVNTYSYTPLFVVLIPSNASVARSVVLRDSTVNVLLESRRPPNVPWFVITVVVNSIKRIVLGTFSQVIEYISFKRRKIMPPLGSNRYATPTIISKIANSLVSTTLFDILPPSVIKRFFMLGEFHNSIIAHRKGWTHEG